jgi:cysteine desulfurase/selenocysteine lyase
MSRNDFIRRLDADEAFRRHEFPIAAKKIFMGHAGLTVMPRRVVEAVHEYNRIWSEEYRDFSEEMAMYARARALSANLIGAGRDEIALMGPTALGLSLFANGLDWRPGDEVVCFADDYPSNVYPWLEQERKGVTVRYLRPEKQGHLTLELVAAALTAKTRLVALASCHFLSGYRIDVDAIGRLLHERGILFSLDAIQTLGAFETRVDHVDFLSADAHKWMLGPLVVGIVHVKKEHFERLRPTLLGAWNVKSPNFIPQDEIAFIPTAQRYEPGALNGPGIHGMIAALELFEEIGIANISARLLELKSVLVAGLLEKGYNLLAPVEGPNASSITTCTRPGADMEALFNRLTEKNVVASLRFDRLGTPYLRFSPHFYNTREEIETVLALL